MWRRHLDGSASLILSLGINGFSGGLEQALFWCFARMGEFSIPTLYFLTSQLAHQCVSI